MSTDSKIKQNKAQCLNCEQIIESKNRWDFVSCNCKQLWDLLHRTIEVFCATRDLEKLQALTIEQLKDSRHGIAIDGGQDYLRRLFNKPEEYLDLSTYKNEPKRKAKKSKTL